MPRLRDVRSLTDLCLELLAQEITNTCKQDPDYVRLGSMSGTLEWLPGVLADALVNRLINSLIDKRDRTLKPLFAAFTVMPLAAISKLDFRRAFAGYRLSRDLNEAFKSFCEEILVKTVRLTELVLIAKCTDGILKCVSQYCHQLVHLDVSLSDAITDNGLSVLSGKSREEGDNETSSRGCSNLKIINLNSCTNISASSISELVLALPKLRSIYYTDMAKVIQELHKSSQEHKTFPLNYFEFYSSENENFDLKTVPETLPYLTTLKLLVKDEHLNYLTKFEGTLEQIDLELSWQTGQGCVQFFRSPAARNLVHINLQLISLPGECILAIAQNCLKLNTFKFTASTLEREDVLVPDSKYFQSLQYLVCRIYSELGSSDEEEEINGEGNAWVGVRPQTLDFLVQHSTKLIELQIVANCNSYVTEEYLAQVLASNQLKFCEKLVFDSPYSLNLGPAAIDLIMSTLPSLKVLMVSRWRKVDRKCIEKKRQEIKEANYDLELI